MFEAKHLVSLKLEGKIVLSLISGFWALDNYPKRFSELKWILNASDPGLSKALRRLQADGIVERDNHGLYHVKPELRASLGILLQPMYGTFALERMHQVADRLQNLHPVLSIVVFGSIAQGTANYESDIDLLIIIDEWNEPLEHEIHETISQLAVKMGIQIEPIIISTAGLKALFQHELQFLFGVLQGYVFLYDKANITQLFQLKEKEIFSKFEYYEEVPLWLCRVK